MSWSINSVSADEFNGLFSMPIVFQTVSFNELNKANCDKVQYLAVYKENKAKFGFITGIRNGRLVRMPFSAPFYLPSIAAKLKMSDYHSAVQTLVDYYKSQDEIDEISITLPPDIYSGEVISIFSNALFVNGFMFDKVDVNYHYECSLFDENYIDSIDVKARQKLRAALKNNLMFVKVTSEAEVELAYEIIRNNRESKGYPLRMSFEQVKNTIKVIDADFFIVKDELMNPIASAMIFSVTERIRQIIYWGNIAGSDNLKPMNYLAYKVFEYYKEQGATIIDIGPSTDDSIPNYGLCDFKQSIGCTTTKKLSMSYKF